MDVVVARAGTDEAAGRAGRRSVEWPARAGRALLMITVAGFALRLGWLLVAQPAAVSDALGYKSLAERWMIEGRYERFGEPTAWRTPGYIGFLSAGIAFSASELWLGLLNVVASTATIPLVAELARRLGLSVRTAVVAAGLAAVMPPMVLWAPVLGPENLQTPLLLLALVIVAGAPPTTRRARWCGVVFGVAVLVRPESLVYLPVAALVMWLDDPVRLLRRSAIVVGVAAAVCLPWVVRNQVQVGPVGLSSVGGVNFYLAHRDDGYGFEHYHTTDLAGLDEVEMSRRGYELGRESLQERPERLIGDVVEGTQVLYGPPRYAPYFSSRDFAEVGPYPLGVRPGTIATVRTYNTVGWYGIAALAVVGWAMLVRRAHRSAVVLTAMVVANWLCFAVVFWALARYRFPIEPMLCIAAAVPIVAVLRRRSGPGRSGSAVRQGAGGQRPDHDAVDGAEGRRTARGRQAPGDHDGDAHEHDPELHP